jgi:UDP-xylose/UDP-N-acetylglucosamine transporter B4
MALGILILNKKYDWTKYLAVGLISVGIGISTLASTGGTGMAAKQLLPDDEAKSNWFMGICLLTFSLIASSRMGIYQETLYKKYGKHPREALFYCHALPLPGFLMLYKDIYAHAVAFTASQPIDVPLVFATVPIPKHWVYLALIAVAQYVCARSIFTLTTECSSLAVTLVITIRKFVSLVISIFIFKNPFTLVHWSGAMLVFLGTFVFVDFPFSLFRKKKSHSD